MNPTATDWGSIPDLIQAGVTVITTILAIIALWRQQRQAERLKILESELDKTKFEHQTQFAKLHEKRAEVIEEIYRQIVVLEIWVNHVVAESTLPDEAFTSRKVFAKTFETVFGQISLNLQKLAAYFNLNRLFLDEHLCTKIVYFHDILLEETEPIYGFFYQRFKQMSEKELQEIYGDNLEERAKETLRYVSDSRRAVENEFRDLLGIKRVNEAKDKDSQFVNELMWIPTPHSIDPIEWNKQPRKKTT